MNNCLNFNHQLNFRYFWRSLFKQNCMLCAATETTSLGLCRPCETELPHLSEEHCNQCALPSHAETCGRCLSNPPAFDKTDALFDYVFPINAVIQAYKYNQQLQTSWMLGSLLGNKVSATGIDMIVPMPMHPQRLKERGFNQALEIAKNLPSAQIVNYQDVVRIKNTSPQASLPLKARAKNIRNAFQTNIELTGLRIAIVDDVMTTGASLNELAKTLKKAGANHVECWVIARTLPRS